ncbi:MAG TPA: protein kinase [Pyrinomonadaceae bacterium]|nr:protein kinase [Pyrinomonadaceae bacterium]
MTPERWQQISRIFKSAISLDGAARAAYLANQCGTDESLRSEVEKLLSSHRQASAEDFIGGRAADDGAVLLVTPEELKPRLEKGQKLGSYLILDQLGAGGMGEVYLAKDSRLERTVALKVLSPDISEDQRRMQRFRQEAKVASSLNQPNILTIFESGEIDGLTFLATEFIDGETLRSYLNRERLKTAETIDIAIQVLTALEAAHEARIVHRDIKPENVMIRHRDRVVKVLDFGLAKVTEKRTATQHDLDAEAVTEFKTTPGVLMGTINYMSPEQARAATVDERTDIWSVGVMLYEMVTGLMPFGGPTSSHTLVQILDKELPAFPKVVDAPAELQRIVRKALAKSPDERYQTAKDFAIDLKSLRRQLDVKRSVDDTDQEPDDKRAGKEPSKTRVLVFALVAMAIVTAAFFGWSVWRAARARSSSVVIPAPGPVTPQPERRLTYSITVQEFRNGKYEPPYTMAAEVSFEPKDRVRLNVGSPQTGYLYILNEGPRDGSAVPEYSIMFPSASANNGSPLLAAEQHILIPAEPHWFQFDTQAGVERLWLIFSEDAVAELESVRRFASKETQGVIADMTQNKLIQDFLTTHSATKPETEKGETLTTLTMPGKLLLYPVRLEHH